MGTTEVLIPVELETEQFKRQRRSDGKNKGDTHRETESERWRAFHVMLISVNPHSPLTSKLTSSDLDDPCCHGNWKNKYDTPLPYPLVSER